METFNDLCQDCAASYNSLRSWLNTTYRSSYRLLRKWETPEDYKNNCSFCTFVAQLKHERRGVCDGVSDEHVILWAHKLSGGFVQPPIDQTSYLEFQWGCFTSLWYFFEDEDRIKGTTGFTYQLNPELDETDWKIIRQWIDGCIQRHQSDCMCRDPFDVPGFEVIDCNTRKLVLWDKKADFAALSYVWGLTETQADRPKGLPETKVDRTILPNPFPVRVIEDALICTSKLNIRYLWVDRYCIDQDGTNDTKQRFIQSMDKIYSAAKVTIIDAAGNDALAGLTGVSETLRIISSKVVIDNRTVIPVNNPHREISSSRWAKRGWTLQEGLLACRRLVFTNTRVYFQCTQSHCVEGLFGEFHSTEEEEKGFDHTMPQVAMQAFPNSIIGSGLSSSSMGSVCNKFTSRDLKTDEDALNACLGIFSRFWTSTKPEYQYCGLPFQAKSNAAFASSLLWRFKYGLPSHDHFHENPTKRRRAWGASWSWLAWRGNVRFDSSSLQQSGMQSKTLVEIKFPRRHEEQDVMSTISDYVGDIDSGGLFQHWLPYLRLSGWIATTRFGHKMLRSDKRFDGHLLCHVAKEQGFSGQAEVIPQMWAKVLEEDEEFNLSRLLDIMFIADDGRMIHGLIIHRIGEETADTFERMGTCQIYYASPEIKQVQNVSYLSTEAEVLAELETDHHANSASFSAALKAGCFICKALASEIENVEQKLEDPSITSSTIWESSISGAIYEIFVCWIARGPNKAFSHARQIVLVPSQAINTWKTGGMRYQPKRLVDIGNSAENVWKLVLREDVDIRPSQYATLSHRWASNQQTRLFKSNVKKFKTGQSVSCLPQAFQDAITVANSLGIRYIWIDCLCIIQDSVKDWKIESLEMCKIYSHAAMNLSATGSPNNAFGFLQMLDKPLLFPPQIHETSAPKLKNTWQAVDPFFWWAEVTKTPLMRRGWVFQERFLAPRVLHFGEQQMLWECATLDACEIYPSGLISLTKNIGHTGFKKLDAFLPTITRLGLDGSPASGFSPDTENTSLDDELLYFWCNTVESYTRTSLTKHEDKLIALSGVAEMMSGLYQILGAESSGYAAGIFTYHALLMLEWHTHSALATDFATSASRPPVYRTPSWSWAGIEGRVYYEFLPRVFGQWGTAAERRSTTWVKMKHDLPNEHIGWKPLVTDLTTQVTPVAGSVFGQISGGSLRCHGRVVPVATIMDPSISSLLYEDPPLGPDEGIHGTYVLPLRCVEVIVDGQRSWYITGLMIQPVEGRPGTYRRCGLFFVSCSTEDHILDIETGTDLSEIKYSDGTILSDIDIV
ncbi:hypothetical protein G7054_g14342 [Neopestalotiopsis clavispora]|nr:hypothetical protein G7054_g14342 [Neopestalotiopsis clavispora]